MFSNIKKLIEKRSLKGRIFLNTFLNPSLFLSYSTFISVPKRVKRETNEYFKEIALNQANLIIKISNTIVKSSLNTLRQNMHIFKSYVNKENPFSNKDAPTIFSSIIETSVATIFKRENDNFLRIATSLKTEDGKLAVNTYLDKNHPAREKLLNGQSYFGRAYMFEKDYMALYEPIIRDGEVIGAYFVGLNIAEQLKQLKDFLKTVKIGEKGYVYAVDLMKDLIVVHPEDEGLRISEIKKTKNLSFYYEMLKKRKGIIEYTWPDEPSKNTKPKEKIAIFEIVEDLNWLIVLSYYKEDIERKAKSSASKLQNSLIFTGITNIMLMFISTLHTLNQVTKTLKSITDQIKDLRSGSIDLKKTIKVETRDEIGELTREFNNLLQQINDIQVFREEIKNAYSFNEAFDFTCNFLKENFGIDECLLYPFFDGGATSKYCLNQKTPKFNSCPSLSGGRILMSSDKRCPHFSAKSKEFVCLPINFDRNTGYIIQLIKEGKFDNKGRLLQYLEEAQPLLLTKKQLELLKEQSLKDELTGLYNRRFLNSTIDFIIEHTKRHKKSLGVLMCDLDHFKRVNDTYGHDVGDLVLKGVAEIIKSSSRRSDLTVRYGGEEFLVLLTDIDKNGALKVAEKIRKNIEGNVFRFDNTTVSITISIGVSIYPEDTDDFEKVVKMADQALYKAKEGGRNRIELINP